MCDQSAVPTISCFCAWLLLIVNIFIPGVGTVLMGVVACDCCCVLIGILQLILAPLLIGWIWAIIWSVIAIGKSV